MSTTACASIIVCNSVSASASQAEVEAETLGDKKSDAQALDFRLADSVAEVEAETLGDTLSDAYALVDRLVDLRKHWFTRWLTRNQKWRQRR